MKFKVQMKDPDTLSDAVMDAVAAELRNSGLEEYEQELLQETRHDKTMALCKKWFRYGEYLTVEIDTDAGTCVVVPHD